MKKSIFITGAASGIGRATAVRFAKEGCFVGLYDVNSDGVRELSAELGKDRTHHGHLDVTDLEEFKKRCAEFADAAGRFDVLFNNAGLMTMGPFLDIEPARARKMIEVNCIGVMNGVYAAAPHLERSGAGVILNMCSASAIYGIPDLAAYSASKFFVRGLTEALEIELAQRNIRVSDLMPSYVATPMVSSQTHRAGTLDSMGVKLTAEKIADVVWRAAHKRRTHFIPQLDVALLRRFAGLLPEVARVATRRLSHL